MNALPGCSASAWMHCARTSCRRRWRWSRCPRSSSGSRGNSSAVAYPIESAGRLLGLLLVIDDVTEKRARAREDAEQRELLAAFKAIMRDRNGFATFFRESERMLESLGRRTSRTLTHASPAHAQGERRDVRAAARRRTLPSRGVGVGRGNAVPRDTGAASERWAAITHTLRSITPSYRATEVSEQTSPSSPSRREPAHRATRS